MMLVRLLYVSRAVNPEDQKAIDGILGVARTHNAGQGITGILCYGDGVFMQCIEGGRAAINRLYAQILRDPRHQDVVLLRYEEITERQFSGWTMGLVNLNRVNTSIMLKYSETPTFDPYSVSGEASQAMLQELIATASIIGRS
jgi:hypothetical protein